ncbi:hypothetical protein M501DRAFT_1005225 [Patellaria atrata CBS 101060]|uniref:RING-type domain-containing protein n=1 Tax=Patellaria atrata CBS 101060 TaxID=1346257 RepID=A0A9P4VP28_9PEZI|nr:hypothetical protein M501DRAFT_1005225 [Patellaria atrata CBS 101060]
MDNLDPNTEAGATHIMNQQKSSRTQFLGSIHPLSNRPALDDPTDGHCPVCLEPYPEESLEGSSQDTLPAQLPCKHLIGIYCLKSWTAPPSQGGEGNWKGY